MPIATAPSEPEWEKSPQAQGTVSVDVGAISSTISAVLSQVIKSAFTPENLTSIIGGNTRQKQQVVMQDVPSPHPPGVDLPWQMPDRWEGKVKKKNNNNKARQIVRRMSGL